MALTIGEYLYKRLVPEAKEVRMNVSNLDVLHAQVAKSDTCSAQLLEVHANIDLLTQATTIRWYNVSEDGVRAEEAYASAMVCYEDPSAWQTEWDRMTHLVHGRIEALSRMAADGTANKLSKNMAYTLFKNVVDYADRYRGMESVTLNEYEAYADVTLVPERHGTWHTPPQWIDSIFHLGGLIMNGSDASHTKDFFYVTPGWDSCRIAKPLEPGASYRSYVKMFPTKEANMYAGDVYVQQGDVVVAMMGAMKFRRVPRLLMAQFFSPPDVKQKNSTGVKSSTSALVVPASKQASATQPAAIPQKPPTAAPNPKSVKQPPPAPETPKPAAEDSSSAASSSVAPEANPTVASCLRLIAGETGLDVEELTDEASFVELGVDSLMSLVLAAKFHNELGLEVKSSLFIECASVGKLKAWLKEYC